MAGRSRTPLHLLTNPRGGRAPVAPRVQGDLPDGIPPFPLGDTGERRLARDAWTALWTSSAGELVDPIADAVPLYRWMRDLDEWEQLSARVRAAPVIEMPNGTPKANPLYARLAQLSRQLVVWEDRFGLTPRGRQLLRVQSSPGSVDELMAMLLGPIEDDGDEGEDA
jgi:hypothetical protein